MVFLILACFCSRVYDFISSQEISVSADPRITQRKMLYELSMDTLCDFKANLVESKYKSPFDFAADFRKSFVPFGDMSKVIKNF